jgi:arabinofuranosyltransferase
MTQSVRASRLFWLFVPIAAAFVFGAAIFRGHHADDALIGCRYGENLVEMGQLIYNAGEYVSSLTSPLLGLVYAGLYALTGKSLGPYQAFAFALLVISVILLVRHFRGFPRSQVAAAVAILPLPCVILWSWGGLETGLLLFFITILSLAAIAEKMTPGRLCFISLMAGICFVTRYDSCLFTGPVVLLVMWRNRQPRHIAAAAIVGAILPAAWLIFAQLYYGDIFPTSFYIKASLDLRHPSKFARNVWTNFSYMLQFVLLTGFLPLLAFAIRPSQKQHGLKSALTPLKRDFLPLLAGMALMFVYGLTVASAHMMYSFRLLVPYVPAIALVIGGAHRQDEARQPQVPARGGFVALILLLTVFQAWQSWYTYAYSVNGAVMPLATYEWTWLGTKAQTLTLEAFRLGADDIRKDWESLPNRPDREPRIWTIAGGTTPYYYRQAYVLEALASYRKYCQPPLKPIADYIQIAPDVDYSPESLLPGPIGDYRLVSRRPNPLHPKGQEILIFYNPHPAENPLPARVKDPCR